MTVIAFKVVLKRDDDCSGCPMQSCGHWGRPTYCMVGFGETPFTYRDREKNDDYYKRPAACIAHFKKHTAKRIAR